MIQFRKLVSGALTISTALALSGAGLVTAYAAPLTQSFVQLSDSRSTANSSYTVTFNVASTTAVKAFKLQWSNRPSGSGTIPDNLNLASSTLVSVKKNASVTGSFTADLTNGATGVDLISDSGGTGALVAGNTIEIVISGITNNTAAVVGGNECDSVANSDSCYLRINTYSDAAATLPLDSSVASWTVVAPVTVTATIDPSLTFTVTGVASGVLASNDGTGAISCANEVTSTPTTLPFGNLGVGIGKSRCTQHSLAVATNAAYGYDTYLKFDGASASTNMMTGTISGNNIDPYTGTFSTPTAFSTDPSGSAANVNTGWLGVRSTNIGSFGGANLYAGPAVNQTAVPGDKVMTKTTPDIGTTPTFVTYKIAVNALQPADTYTGTAIYNVVAKY